MYLLLFTAIICSVRLKWVCHFIYEYKICGSFFLSILSNIYIFLFFSPISKSLVFLFKILFWWRKFSKGFQNIVSEFNTLASFYTKTLLKQNLHRINEINMAIFESKFILVTNSWITYYIGGTFGRNIS